MWAPIKKLRLLRNGCACPGSAAASPPPGRAHFIITSLWRLSSGNHKQRMRGAGQPKFVLAELEYFNDPSPPSQADGFHRHIFLRRADLVLLWMLLVLLPLQPLLAILHPSRGAGTCSLPLEPGWVDETVSGSPVSQPLVGFGLFHWLMRVGAGSVQTCHPCGLQPQMRHYFEFSAGAGFPSSPQPAASLPTTTNIRTTKMVFYFKRSVACRGSCVTSWLHFAANDLAYRVTQGGTPDMLPGYVGGR